MASTARCQVSIQSARRLPEALTHDLEALAAQALEPNVFYESWMLGPAVQAWAPPDLLLVTVRDAEGALAGFFPARVERCLHGLIPALRTWRYLHCFLCTPLIAQAQAGDVFAALAEWIRSGRSPAGVLELDGANADGPFAQALAQARQSSLRHWPARTLSVERALLDLGGSCEPAISGGHRKKLNRLERKLAECGDLAVRTICANDASDTWVDAFLALEASGWKGRERTALASDERGRNFFRRVVADAARRGRLQFLALELDGRPLAMKCGFTAGQGAYVFKIAYDEAYSKYSPGALLELFHLRHLQDGNGEVRWIDSCAAPQNFMYNRLWNGRRTIAHHLLVGRGFAARALVRNWHVLASLRSRFQRAQPCDPALPPPQQ